MTRCRPYCPFSMSIRFTVHCNDLCHGRRIAGHGRIPAEHVFARVSWAFLEGKQHNQHTLCRLSSQNEAFRNTTKKPTEDDCDPVAWKELILCDSQEWPTRLKWHWLINKAYPIQPAALFTCWYGKVGLTAERACQQQGNKGGWKVSCCCYFLLYQCFGRL